MTQERKQFQYTEDGHLLLMSNEERNLLITDLTARLKYGVICLIERVDDFGPIHRNEKLTGFCFEDDGYFHFEVNEGLDIDFAEKIMPYLRPMPSMTDDEKKELKELCKEDLSEFAKFISDGHGLSHDGIYMFDKLRELDFLNSHHFDYRGLIPMGLALEAPEDMYNF